MNIRLNYLLHTVAALVLTVGCALPSEAKGKALKLNELPEARAKVWQEWVAANASENVLPALSDLAAPDSLLWVIPDTLEPNANLNFHYAAKGEAPAEGYPLYIYLHGSGPRDHEWKTGTILAQRFDVAPAAFFIPQIPNEGEYYRWYQKSKQWFVERLLRAALASGKIDPARIYLYGISEGGYGSQRLASFYADYLAAAGPMAGGEPLKNAPVENLRNTPFSLRTGKEDYGFYRDRLTGYTAAALDSIAALAGEGEYEHWVELIPERGHHIDYAPTPSWLSTHHRVTSPKRLTWENFEMDGRYRSGFGNLQVIERSNDDESARTRYDMEILDNVVNLNVNLVNYECTELDPRWGIELKFNRTYTPAEKGAVRVFLDENMVDFSKPVTVIVNGQKKFKGKLRPNMEDLRRSCEEYYDPLRLYPASVVVNL